MSVALIQEVRFAVSFKQQPNLTTSLPASDMWSLRQTNTDFIQATPVNEDDAADLGKGVYTTELFPDFIEAGGPWNGYLTAEAAAMLACYGIGTTVQTGGGPFVYTCAAPVFATSGLQMPAATMLLQIRTGGAAITDKTLFGMCCEEFHYIFKEGPGRQNATFTSQWLGTGSYTKPSGLTMPNPYAENRISAGGITAMTFSGFNYLTNFRMIEIDFGWKNNIRDQSSYFPGSGNEAGFQLRGRMRRAAPTITLRTQVECDSGSSEEDLLIAGTPGTGTLTAFDAGVINGVSIAFVNIIPRAVKIADADGIASYNVDWTVMQDSGGATPLTVTATCQQSGILAVGP